ncbi:uncharacterized protein LOC116267841 isoform X2 [Nymphaea colorata]|uniref:uncharacterized protein LOC116267841 isoform X2 n=1 Tax=Nymphaea colorata TaxID=210225 RepID=UPI00214E9AA9|nr:uncharacterized protein LOC116267841 isoform X2 [Nymphaea colorata]
MFYRMQQGSNSLTGDFQWKTLACVLEKQGEFEKCRKGSMREKAAYEINEELHMIKDEIWCLNNCTCWCWFAIIGGTWLGIQCQLTKLLASGAEDEELRIWDVSDPAEPSYFPSLKR